MMYGSLKRIRNNRIKYSTSYDDSDKPLSDDWYQDTSGDVKENIEDLNVVQTPQDPLDETLLSDVSDVVLHASPEDAKPLIFKVGKDYTDTNTDTSNNNKYGSSPGKKTKLSMGNIFMFILVIFLLYSLYKYSNKFKGKSFFGARECISYDISNAYNMVR